MEDQQSSKRLVIDLATSTGPIKHGAAGFLYGLGKDEIPSGNMLAPLKPQVAAQKPEGGLQHPNGDALNVSRTYQAAGGREIEIYIQDSYPNWPYDFLGLADYLGVVERVVRQVESSPMRALFSYVPFNEPDQIWYNKTDRKQAFFDDWKTVTQKIKAIAPAARIVGPNFASYDPEVYRDFMVFASKSDCLPDVISWHELNNNFFDGWYKRFADFRSIESSLSLPPREICINEYCRIKGDLGVPGQLIQWMTRFENSKVDACLAYWTDAGSLNNLVTRDHYNRATGAWWLYRWYGGMTGETVKVTPPDSNAEGLQALAALDQAKRQVRILLGGCSGDIEMVFAGCDNLPEWGGKVHAAVWITRHTGFDPAEDPEIVLEGDYDVIGSEFSLLLENIDSTAAYQVILTPHKLPLSPQRQLYPTEYVDLSSDAHLVYSGQAHVDFHPGGGVSFVVTASNNGFYKILLNYTAETENPCRLGLALNGSHLSELSIPATQGWSDFELDLFLTEGINRLAFEVLEGTEVSLRSLVLAPGQGKIRSYEAESPTNILSGSAVVIDDPMASGAKCVGADGTAKDSAVEFTNIKVLEPGLYRMVVYFSNADFRGGHSYNSQVVDRHADLIVNGSSPKRVYFRNTFSWDNFQNRVVDLDLQAGNNSVKFANSNGEIPRIDRIEVAAPIGYRIPRR